MGMSREARYSLRWRLPLLACGVMAALLITFLWVAYARVESTLLTAAGERAQIAADQVAGLLDGQRSLEQLKQLGADPVLRGYLESPTSDAEAAANARIKLLAAGGARRVELWDAAGTKHLEAAQTTGPAKGLPAGSLPLTPGVHALQAAGNLVFSDLVAEFPGKERPLGFLLIRSTFTENPPGVFSRLVGRDAQVRIGNTRGDVWTDFSGPVPAAPVDLGRRGVATYTAANGEQRLGAVSHVRGTPLAAWVDFPAAALTAPASMFLRQMAPIALVFLAAAAIVLSVLSSRITRPLSELTVAAESIATGDYSQRVSEGRRDEVGRLARTFNTMAGQVQEAQHVLESRVAERTAGLQAANAELEAFSYSVSHDLRAPLRGIDGFSQALLDEAGERLNETEIGYLKRVRTAAQRMAQLIDDLIELGRVGRTELKRSRVDLSAIARQFAEELQRNDPQRRVQFEIQDGMVMNADAGLMRIIMDNLLGNAWKFTANTAAAHIQVGSNTVRDNVIYFVRDNGAGFDMAYATKLFQPFQRLHRVDEFTGTGIGLATVRRIIERHGGHVSADGVVGEGATVRFTLD